MKKITLVLIVSFLSNINIFACELCKSHQPELLKDIAHGMGPQGTIDYVIMWSAVVVVLITLILSLRYLILADKLDQIHPIKFLPINENS